MKKLLQALSLALLLYCLFLVVDLFRSESAQKTEESSAPPSVVEATPPPELSLAQSLSKPAHSEQLKKKKWSRLPKGSLKKQNAQNQELAVQEVAPETPPPLEKFTSPLAPAQPAPAKSWERQALPSSANACAADRDCTPRGRDGVLMLGSSFASNQAATQWQGGWNVGSVAEQTPLMYLK